MGYTPPLHQNAGVFGCLFPKTPAFPDFKNTGVLVDFNQHPFLSTFPDGNFSVEKLN